MPVPMLIDRRSGRRIGVTVLILWIAMSAVAIWLGCRDREYFSNSVYKHAQELEHVSSAKVAACVDDAWTPKQKHEANVSILIDTILFIPLYVLLLAVACFGLAKFLTGDLQTLGVWLGRGAIVAGICDWLENAGMYLELNRQAYALAPYTFTVSTAKWILIFLASAFAIVIFIGRRSFFGQHGVKREDQGR